MITKFIIKLNQMNILEYSNFHVEIFMCIKILVYPYDMVFLLKIHFTNN